jgi:hypothetical protein
MKSIFTFIILAALLASSSASAAVCKPPKPPEIVVQAVEAPLTTDRSLSIPALSKINTGPTLPGLAGYDHALGVTETQLQAAANGAFEGEIRDSAVCAYAQQITVTVNWKIVVRYAAEIPPGSCIDREVTRHEQSHVALSRQFIPTVRRALEEAVTKAAAKGVEAGSFDAARKQLWTKVTAAIKRVDQKNYAALKTAQAKLDTPEEYDALPRICGQDALQNLLRR